MSISTPTKITVPFASSGSKNTIPVPSQITVTPGAASYTDGFPPLTMTPKASGGVPPFGQDMNGILYSITQAVQFSQSGGSFAYDSTYAASVGGYPQYATVLASDGSGFWLNTTSNNTSAPESFGAGWVPFYQQGGVIITMGSSNVTLTALQAGKNMIRISGSLSSNLNLIFPAWVKEWLVVNETSGSYVITAKTSAGSGVSLGAGSNQLYGDGVNIYMVSNGLGVNQSWSDMTSSRALGTTYTNTTGRPIQVFVCVTDTGISAPLTYSIGGITVTSQDLGTYAPPTLSFVIPNGSSYSIANNNACTINKWLELR